MRRLSLSICMTAGLLGAPAFCVLATASAATAAPEAPRKDAPKEAPRAPVTLDDLFARLKAAKDDGEARGVAQLIEHRLDRSGSDTVDLLASRAAEAMQAKDYPLAVELLLILAAIVRVDDFMVVPPGTEFTSGGINGLFDSKAPDARVTALWAGATCIHR